MVNCETSRDLTNEVFKHNPMRVDSLVLGLVVAASIPGRCSSTLPLPTIITDQGTIQDTEDERAERQRPSDHQVDSGAAGQPPPAMGLEATGRVGVPSFLGPFCLGLLAFTPAED